MKNENCHKDMSVLYFEPEVLQLHKLYLFLVRKFSLFIGGVLNIGVSATVSVGTDATNQTCKCKTLKEESQPVCWCALPC